MRKPDFIRTILVFLLVVLFIIITFFALFIYSQNICKTLKLPIMKDSIMDVEFNELDGYYPIIMKGEWEFYYNRWIITDNDQGAMDGYINIPSRWTGKTYNGVKLDNKGYASYKSYIRNVNLDEKIAITITLYSNAYRIFANGNLVTESGILSKEIEQTYVKSKPQEVSFYTVSDTNDIEIVVEVSATKDGGLFFWPLVSSANQYNELFISKNGFGTATKIIYYVIAIMVILLVIFSNIVKLNKKTDFLFIIFIITLIAHNYFTMDMLNYSNFQYKSNFYYYDIFAYLSAFIMIFSYILLVKTYVPINNKAFAIIIGTNIIIIPLYFLFVGYYYRFLLCFIPLFSAFYIIFQILKPIVADYKKQSRNIIFLVQSILMVIMLGLEITDNNGIILLGATGSYSIFISVILILVLLFYILQVKDAVYKAKKTESLEKEIANVKLQALKAQIKPHFVFNMLTNIQNQYHKEIMAGDLALIKFGKHLRLNVDSEYKDMISFEEELDNIQNYFDLENIRYDGKLNLLYDIDYTDFRLPILSLQPLVENAIKYAKTQEKEDGYIQIKSYTDNDNIIIEINDNGVGFNKEEMRANSTGIKNITLRLKYSLNASITIESKINIGTEVRIVIPKGDKNENHSD